MLHKDKLYIVIFLSCAKVEERSNAEISLPDPIRKDPLKIKLIFLRDFVSGKTQTPFKSLL